MGGAPVKGGTEPEGAARRRLPLGASRAAGSGASSLDPERRVERDRRETKRAKVSALAAPAPVVPPTLTWMAVAIASAFVLAGMVTLTLPPVLTAISAVFAVACAAAGKTLNVWGDAAERSPRLKQALGIGLVGLSAAWVGLGLADWMYHGGLDWRIGVAGL